MTTHVKHKHLLRDRRRRPVPAVEPTPVYTATPYEEEDSAGGEGERWVITDALEAAVVDVVPAGRLVDALVGLAANHGRAVDVGVDGRWVRIHADGTTVAADRPWGPQRYEEMRDRDARDLALLGAVAQARETARGTVAAAWRWPRAVVRRAATGARSWWSPRLWSRVRARRALQD
ncbi:hypothetical protein [Actinomyces succiniciruminis]|uniref:Uncharacterized protein n=1 Tax=Actinomyces succiniciruminis TaxID=1522002 RepID=A0A1L7RBK9_9ACTO|nr:hypothetical protein [Actinomyces succiniciruminis]CED91277.1 Hypothetical protein AAM4_1445 [Actinomyces succiniciruminis]